MIRVAVVDDKREMCRAVASMLMRYSEISVNKICAELFTDPLVLLESVAEKGGFDVYFLDVAMPQLSGIRTAEKLRARGERCEIVFLTASREFAVEAFGVEAAGYLLKPISEQQFFAVCDRIFPLFRRQGRPPVFVKTAGGMRKIGAADIVMIESFNHYREITLADGQKVRTPATLAYFTKLFAEYREFYSPHRAYIVNLDYVYGVQNASLLLPNDVVPIAKGVYARFRAYYAQFMMPRK